MSDKSERLLQRVTFRIPRDRIEKINKMIKKGNYKNQSNFLRNAVDLLVYWEKEIKIDDIIDPLLQKNIIDRFSEVEQVEKIFPELEKKMVNDLAFLYKTKKETSIFVKESFNESRKIHEETKKLLKLAEIGIAEYEEKVRKEGLELVPFIIQVIRSLYSQFKDEETPLNIKEWETQTLAATKILQNKVTKKGFTIEELKEIYSIIDASQLKKEEKKKSHGQGEGSGR